MSIQALCVEDGSIMKRMLEISFNNTIPEFRCVLDEIHTYISMSGKTKSELWSTYSEAYQFIKLCSALKRLNLRFLIG